MGKAMAARPGIAGIPSTTVEAAVSARVATLAMECEQSAMTKQREVGDGLGTPSRLIHGRTCVRLAGNIEVTTGDSPRAWAIRMRSRRGGGFHRAAPVRF